jgi:hypothetical protein
MNSELAADFEWFRCPQGYRITQARDVARANGHNPDTYPDKEWIVANSDNRITYRLPMNSTASLVTVFAHVTTPSEALRFANQYGPMGSYGSYWGYSVAGYLRRAGQFRELLLSKEKGPRKVAALYRAQLRAILARADKEAGIPAQTNSEWREEELYSIVGIGLVELVPDVARGVRLRFTTDSLDSAMLWQLGLKLSGATTFRECRQCGMPFEAGPGSKLRVDSTFCCPEHSVLFHSRRRKKGIKDA